MNKAIYIKDWLLFKPYEKQVLTDSYYLKMSNKVKNALISNDKSIVLLNYLNKEDVNHLACFLTSYFEDIISETNIWNSFVKIHKRLYNKPLPFYNWDEYYEDEISTQDVCFLIWYFLSTIQDEKFVYPFDEFIFDIADDVMVVLDEAWEYAPENEYLRSYYQIEKTEDNYYIARNLIDTILFKTYLFHTDTQFDITVEEIDILEKYRDDENLLVYLYDNRDKGIHETRTRLLNLCGKEWASEIIGSEHPLRSHFLNLSQKVQSYFLYKGQDQTDIFIEHIATEKKFKITKKSYEKYNLLNEVDKIMFTGIVKWKDEWWFSGINSIKAFNENFVADEKKSHKSEMALNCLDHQNKEVTEIIKNQLKAFKDFNHGRLIAFLPSNKIDKFLRDYIEFYNKANKKVKGRIPENSSLDTGNEPFNYSEISETGLVYFNSKSGCEIALGVNSAFPLPNNPYFNAELSVKDFMTLLMSDSTSPELAKFCIENCKKKLPIFNDGVSNFLLDDLDFLLRFWKNTNYWSKPSITIVGK